MRILIIDTYYPQFLSAFYHANPLLADAPYNEQWNTLMQQCFGTADFYSRNLKALGHEAVEIVANCEPLQRRWALEHGTKTKRTEWSIRWRGGMVPWPQRLRHDEWVYTTLIEQVGHYCPDVLYIQDMNFVSAAFLQSAKRYVKLIVGQIASTLPVTAELCAYDLILSSFPHFVNHFSSLGLRSRYLRLGFESSILPRLIGGRDTRHAVVFVGGLSNVHGERMMLLEYLASHDFLEIWGYGVDSTDLKSPIRAKHHGPIWGIGMYSLLRDARVVVNLHSTEAKQYANNMRLFEATGVGTLLVTDWKANLHEMFEPGREVVAYRSPEECLDLIAYYLGHEEERQAIASAGQQRTLTEHTYLDRMREIVEILSPLL